MFEAPSGKTHDGTLFLPRISRAGTHDVGPKHLRASIQETEKKDGWGSVRTSRFPRLFFGCRRGCPPPAATGESFPNRQSSASSVLFRGRCVGPIYVGRSTEVVRDFKVMGRF